MKPRTLKHWLLCTIGACLVHGHAAADTYPSKPIRIVVPSAAGGALDVTARLLAQKMTVTLGQSVIIDNRPGAESLLGVRYAKGVPADGYTLLAHSNAFAAAPALKLEPGYDPVKDFVAIGPLMRAPQLLYVGPEVPDRSVPDLIARAKAKPGLLTYAHGGRGSPLHLAAVQFSDRVKVNLADVPYKGTGNAMPDVAGGRVTMIFAGYPGGGSYVRGGKLRALGVTGTTRLTALPDVPTFKEQGVDFVAYFWLGLFAPAGTPAPIVNRLAQALSEATTSPDVVEHFRNEGSEAVAATPQEFGATVARDTADFGRLMRDLKIEKN
ncbi:tripartite tricarboxylate transporter substrate binding protein [Hydrogenophaga sp.]|uniref:Bug family tripartite tricarboxylate transporter substrate binding protein n=1 Tax=Hydrogenophaga sp. TaxID=1904254 RepID=UPI0027180172|nr:tripartite tricarboxylate transporter substrate binding protein [Hydrogenophaga sp.]MDO9437058.1 tripartite tricarboxylate transporter substrate binding protein [Hydrogenophaga sp.]